MSGRRAARVEGRGIRYHDGVGARYRNGRRGRRWQGAGRGGRYTGLPHGIQQPAGLGAGLVRVGVVDVGML